MFIRFSILSSIILILFACGENQSDEIDYLTSATRVAFDSCDIALSTNGHTEQDTSIRQYQEAAANSIQPLANLEKLGWAYISLARRTYDYGYYNLALETSKCIKTKREDHNAALMLQAYVSHQLHNFKDAERLAQKLVLKRGYWFEYGLLGDALVEQGQLDAAESAYQSMMNQRPGPQVYSRAAHLRWLKGDLSGAIGMAKLTVETYGYGKSEVASWAKTKLGYYLLLNSEFTYAYKILKQTLELNNDYAPALFVKGRLHLAQDNPEEAISALKKAVELNPLAEYLWVLFEALETTGKYEEAQLVKSQFEKTAKIEDPRTYALFLASSTQEKALAIQLATEELEKRQDIFSHDAKAWSHYANNEIPQALNHIEIALANKTTDARLYYHAALIHFAANNNLQAGEWFNKAQDCLHMLLPSEKINLQAEFAKFLSHNLSLESETHVSRGFLKKNGDQYENSI